MTSRVILDPTSEKTMASRELLARPATISGQTIGLLDISKARGDGGMAEGVQEAFKDATLPKFRSGGLLLVHAGGTAGLFSAIIGGWVNGAAGSDPVTKVISP